MTPFPAADVRYEALASALANGVRLRLLPEAGCGIVSFQVHVSTGSRHERPGITGISHLFEHLMFKGTPDVGPEQLARAVQAVGGSLNAFTTEDSTCYYETLPSGQLDLAIRLEADRFAHLLLTAETLASEREVVRNERLLRTVNTPYGEARELLMSLAFPRHPYGWPVIGWDADLQALTLDDCRDYFRAHYGPESITVVVSGDFDAPAATARLDDGFGGLPRPGPVPPVRAIEEPQRGERRAEFLRRVEAAAILAAFHVPGIMDPDTLPLLVLSALLSAGESSRLHRRFVRPALASAAGTGVGTSFLNRDPSVFRVEAVCNPGDDPERLEAGLWEEIDRLRREGVELIEVTRAIQRLATGFAAQAETALSRGLQIGLAETRAGDWRWVNSFLPELRRVTPEDVLRVARSWLRPENRTVVTVRPERP